MGVIEPGDWATWVGAGGTLIAIVAATLAAFSQLRVQRQHLAVERTINAHREITMGEAGAARDRLSEFMWRTGSTAGHNRCWQPTWDQLLGSQYMQLPEGVDDLSQYPTDMAPAAGETPLRDLYRILWVLERVGAAYHAGLLDQRLAVEMLGSHAVWWNSLCQRIPPSKTHYRKQLSDLSERFVQIEPSLAGWAAADFVGADGT